MIKFKGFYLILLFISELNVCQSQSNNETKYNYIKPTWFVSVYFGVQMSGIKDEDFIKKNTAPLIGLSSGKWFTKELALRIGYQGYYFNTIADSIKHHYGYYFGEAVFNMNELLFKKKDHAKWSLYLHAGSGYFYNCEYKQPNICANLGIQNNFQITRSLQLSIDAAAIVGWNIYQGDEDILPSMSVGISYLL